MTDTIKSYSELKQLINHGNKVTLDGKLMTNEKVNRMPMAEVRLCIEQGSFETNTAIEGEFIGKGDKPKVETYQGNFDPRYAARSAAQSQHLQNMAMAQQQALAQGQGFSQMGGLGQASLGGIFGGLF